jgi:hypothetical protein
MQKQEGYLPIDKIGGGGSTLWYQITAGSTSPRGYGFTLEFQEIGNQEPNGSGFAVFDTLGAALMYLALAADTVASYGTISVEAWQIEEEFATIAGRFVTHNKTEGN